MRTLILLFVVLSLGGASVLGALSETLSSFTVPGAQYGAVIEAPIPTSVLFGGDIMLGRSVETLILENGMEYPFMHLTDFIKSFDIAVGNFEGSIPEEHVPTKPLQMQFSINAEYLGILKASGFDILSLANNHAFDTGREGYIHTRSVCEAYSIRCFGTPFAATSTSIAIVKHNETRIGMLFLHTLFEETNPNTLRELIATLSGESDIQIVFIHWGEEYSLTHNSDQASLAYLLVDAGADAVIGHHPHVVQDVEKYRGKPIFYSLGNLVFDQYFSEDVQTGYLLGMSILDEEVTYTIYPVESLTNRSQPRLISGDARTPLLERILPKTIFSDTEVSLGSFKIPL